MNTYGTWVTCFWLMLIQSWLLHSLPLFYSSYSFIFFTLFFLPIMSYIIVTLPPIRPLFYLFIYLFAITSILNSFTLSPIHFMFCHYIDNHPHKLLKSTQKKKKKFKCYFRGFKYFLSLVNNFLLTFFSHVIL